HPRRPGRDLQDASLRGEARAPAPAGGQGRDRREGRRMSARECPEFEKALGRGEDAVAALEIHAGGCEECRGRLALWKEISRAAPALRKSWDSPRLFPSIARAVTAASRTPAPAAAVPRRRFAWLPAAAAASLFVLSMIGLSIFKPGESARDPF